MKSLTASAFLLLALLATSLYAQQEIRLKSGTIFFGVARFEGDEAVVKVGESELRFPREEIALIQGAAAPAAGQLPALPEPRRLLNAALEAKLLDGATKEVVGLLAQAAQLAPDDPQIRFWYVTSLVDAGHGKAAEEALAPHREAVAAAYPGAVDRLAARIEARKKLEKLPPALVARIDGINASAVIRSDNERNFQIAFRVVDQHGAPIEPAFVHLTGYANNEQLESFGDGFYVYAFSRSGNSDESLKLSVEEVGVRPEEFAIAIHAGPLSAPKEFVVHRLSDEDRVPLRVRVADRDGKPVAKAKVSLRPVMSRGNASEVDSAATDDDGVVEFKVVPFNYVVEVNAEGFKQESQGADARDESDRRQTVEVKLYPVLKASIRAAWRIAPVESGGETTTGEGVLSLGGRVAYPNDANMLFRVLRPMQVEDRLAVQLAFFGGYPFPPYGDAMWLRSIDVSADGEDAAAAVRKKFDAIDLSNTTELKKVGEAIDLNPAPGRPPGLITLQKDRVYIGEMPFHDPRAGRPARGAFKLMMELDAEAPKSP